MKRLRVQLAEIVNGFSMPNHNNQINHNNHSSDYMDKFDFGSYNYSELR
ncbi:MAG: hypothetical protein LBL39_04040 [Planctomycetaceae bacterium]|nr:hypothetical protein [Planctomycetaceae bacterium]